MRHFILGNNEIQSKKRNRILLKVTWKMIADAKGVSKRTVQRAVKSGKLDVLDLKSIAEYVVREK